MRAAYPLLAVLLIPLHNTPTSGGGVLLPNGGRIETVDFERHVQGLFGKLGCNAGPCHGSFQGKGGLYLSLFGHSPEKDLLVFTRESMGRRISIANVFRLFGRPTPTATCDCERPAEPALPQTLYLMHDAVILKKITDGRLKDLLALQTSDEEIIEELMLSTLSRLPIERERKRLLEHVQSKKRLAGFANVVWALINTREFILNH